MHALRALGRREDPPPVLKALVYLTIIFVGVVLFFGLNVDEVYPTNDFVDGRVQSVVVSQSKYHPKLRAYIKLDNGIVITKGASPNGRYKAGTRHKFRVYKSKYTERVQYVVQ